MSKALLSATPSATPDTIDSFRVSKVSTNVDTGWSSVICQPVAKGNYADVVIVLPPNDAIKQLWCFGTEPGTKYSPACSFTFALVNTISGGRAMSKIQKLWSNHNLQEEPGVFKWDKHLEPILGSYFQMTGTPTCHANEYGCQFIDGSIFLDKKVETKDKVQKLIDLTEMIGPLDQVAMDREWATLHGSTPANRSTPKALA